MKMRGNGKNTTCKRNRSPPSRCKLQKSKSSFPAPQGQVPETETQRTWQSQHEQGQNLSLVTENQLELDSKKKAEKRKTSTEHHKCDTTTSPSGVKKTKLESTKNTAEPVTSSASSAVPELVEAVAIHSSTSSTSSKIKGITAALSEALTSPTKFISPPRYTRVSTSTQVSNSSNKSNNSNLKDMVIALNLNWPEGIARQYWVDSFQINAFLVQIVMDTVQVKKDPALQFASTVYKINQRSNPKQVAFTTLDCNHDFQGLTPEHFKVTKYNKLNILRCSDDEEFEEIIRDVHKLQFDTSCSIDDDVEWQHLMKYLSENKYQKREDRDWKQTTAKRDFPFALKKLSSLFHNALTHGMANDEGKALFEEIVNYIIKKENISPLEIDISRPSNSSKTNGRVQLVSSSKFFKRFDVKITKTMCQPFSDESDRSDDYSVGVYENVYKDEIYHAPKKEVTDLLIKRPNEPDPQIVAFLVLKKKEYEFKQAERQLTKQGLTFLHFQRYVFGFVVSDSSFAVFFFIKKKKTIRVYRFKSHMSKMVLEDSEDEETSHELIIENLTKLCNWIYWVVKYAKSKVFRD